MPLMYVCRTGPIDAKTIDQTASSAMTIQKLPAKEIRTSVATLTSIPAMSSDVLFLKTLPT